MLRHAERCRRPGLDILIVQRSGAENIAKIPFGPECDLIGG